LNNIGCYQIFSRQPLHNTALDESEDDILWENDAENKDDYNWVADKDSVMSDDGESDE